jgi:uncharacterized membrane protein
MLDPKRLRPIPVGLLPPALIQPLAKDLAGIGLLIAGTMSVVTVIMEVARKKALGGRALIPVLFWCHGFDSVVFVGLWLIHRWLGDNLYVLGGGNLFGITGLRLSPLQIYWVYQFLDQAVHCLANLTFFKSLQEGALSVTVPFLSFTSVLLIPLGFLFLGELPSATNLVGVLLATGGGIFMHWRLFSHGWLAPVKAIYRDRGSRYMVYTCLLLAVLSPLDKKLAVMTDIYTQAVIFGLSQTTCFLVMSLLQRLPIKATIQSGLYWIALAGILDGSSILLQFSAYRYIDVVTVIAIKRAGIILSVFCGWLFFKERNIRDRLMAASIIFVGVTILYSPLSFGPAAAVAAACFVAAWLYVGWARRRDAALPRSSSTQLTES